MRVVGNVLAFYGKEDFLSNHHYAVFTIKGITFDSMEKAIMYAKAMLFKDPEIAEKILQATHPQACKVLGRQVKNFNETKWAVNRPKIYRALLKFRYDQNPEDKQRLIDTHPLILAEAAEHDDIWGVKLKESDDRIGDPKLWKGLNICGATQQRLREHYLT